MTQKQLRMFGDLDAATQPPFETQDLRVQLDAFLNTEVTIPGSSDVWRIGNFRWGVYAFYDYDDEPIYVGQTNEMLRTRIRRHLTNQRTDAVAMSVLDPFEVYRIVVWPLPQFEGAAMPKGSEAFKAAKRHLDALEHMVHAEAVQQSNFKAILNEKDPPLPQIEIDAPTLRFEGRIVSPEVYEIRAHPDFRIARRALIISRLAQVISERKVQGGLRRTLITQAKRLAWLAERRFVATGGEATVESEDGET